MVTWLMRGPTGEVEKIQRTRYRYLMVGHKAWKAAEVMGFHVDLHVVDQEAQRPGTRLHNPGYKQVQAFPICRMRHWNRPRVRRSARSGCSSWKNVRT